MSVTSTNGILRYIRSLVSGREIMAQSDESLLQRFVSERDETAFVGLLERHGPLAMGVCLRVLQDKHLAEDAFQATFLVLAVKARSIRKRGSFASWLYGVALRLARKLKTQAYRSQKIAGRMIQEPIRETRVDVEDREQQLLVDEEVSRLPDKYRLPILLCYFEGRTHEEAAAQLGWSAGKVKGLLDRGRDRLRNRLIRRGVAVSAGAATFLSASTLSAAVPKTLAIGTSQAAIKVVSGKSLAACGISAAVATLAKGGLLMGTKKLLLIFAFALLGGPLGIGAVMWAATGEIPFANLTEEERFVDRDDPQAIQRVNAQDGKAAKKDGEDDPEELVIDRFIDVLKNASSADQQRYLACVALGKRGPKAKRALPEMNKYLEAALQSGVDGFKGGFNGANDTPAEKLEKTVAAVVLVGVNNKDTFDLLKKSIRPKDKSFDDGLRIAAIEGLGQFIKTSDKSFKAKGMVELQVIAETDLSNPVREAATAVIQDIRGQKKNAPYRKKTEETKKE